MAAAFAAGIVHAGRARNARWEGIMPGGTYGIVGLVVAIIVAVIILRLAGIL